MTAPREETVEEIVERTTREQGVPRYIEDPVLLRRLVELAVYHQREAAA